MTRSLEYDENGAIFGHFCIALFSFFLIPLTYYILKHKLTVKTEKNIKSTCLCSHCKSKVNDLDRKNRSRWKKAGYWILLSFLWFLFAYFSYTIHNYKFESKIERFDPFEILQISPDASQAEIKAAYRRLVLIKHPDRGGDVEEYITISKAYKALTDEVARENFIKYGNPDGPSSPSLGIALPSFLIDKKYSRMVLLAYFVVIILGFPFAITIWWYYSKQYYSEKLLATTTQMFCHFIRTSSDLKWKRIITIVSGSCELSPKYSSFMKISYDQSKDLHGLVTKLNVKSKKEGIFNQMYCVKARALMYAHFSRIEIPPSLKTDLDKLLVKFLSLLGEFQNIQSCFVHYKSISPTNFGCNLESLIDSMKLSSLVVQGLNVFDSPLLQLPHVDQHGIALFQRKKKSINTVQSFVAATEKDRSILMKGLSESQQEDIYSAIASMPNLNMKVVLKVGDDINPTEVESYDVLSVIIYLQRVPLSTKLNYSSDSSLPTKNEIDANNKCSAALDSDDIVDRCELKKDYDQSLYYAHAPRFPYEKKEGWWAYLLDASNQLISTPIYFNFKSDYEKIVLQFSSSIVGQYRFRCFVFSDSYVDFVFQKEMAVMIVKPKPPVSEHPQWNDLSEEDVEDIDEILTDTDEPLTK